MAAAPADFYLEKPAMTKIKRKSENLELSLSPAPDILQTISSLTSAVVVAFALETDNGRK